MKLYTVDRKGTLNPGDICDLVVYDDINPKSLANHVSSMFPGGVSAHGERYFLQNSAHSTIISPMLELVFEYVRRSKFPHLPSRFQCMFAMDSVAAANQFKHQYDCNDAPVYRVESQTTTIKVDMTLLTAQTVLVTSHFGHLYWSGEKHPEIEPFWEYLLRCPVTVCERVE